MLQTPNNDVIALLHLILPIRYQGHGDVYAVLRFIPIVGTGVMHPPFMDMVVVTALLYRFALAFNP